MCRRPMSGRRRKPLQGISEPGFNPPVASNRVLRWARRWLSWGWTTLRTPAATLGFLTLGGFLGGVIFWGAFNTALELTDTEPFCLSVMRCMTTFIRS